MSPFLATLPYSKGAPMQLERGPKLLVNEAGLINWMRCPAYVSQAPTMKNIKEHAEKMVQALPVDALLRMNCTFRKSGDPFSSGGTKTL